ncbi:MAG: PilX N-terminal domain-containing pilus assembly protein, partial [Janthinobacterium sp.]
MMAGAGGRCCEPWCAARVRHGGATLVYVLCLLVIILLLGISAAQMALQGEKAARGERDRQIAFQAAEEALVDAQNDIEGLPGAPGRSNLFASGSAAGFADGCG